MSEEVATLFAVNRSTGPPGSVTTPMRGEFI